MHQEPDSGSEQEDLSDFSSVESDYLYQDKLDLIESIESSDPTRDLVLSGFSFPSVRDKIKTFESRGASAPTSPVKQRRPSVTLINRSGSCNSFFKMALSEAVQTALAPLKKSRRGFKAWVTRTISKVVEEEGAGTLTSGAFTIKYDSIKDSMDKVVKVQDQINQVFDNYNVNENHPERVADEQETDEFLNKAQMI